MRSSRASSATTPAPSNPSQTVRGTVGRLPPTTRAASTTPGRRPDGTTPLTQQRRSSLGGSSATSSRSKTFGQDLGRKPQADPKLLATLHACLDEVRKLDFRNAELERELKKSENQVRELTLELEKVKLVADEKSGVEETNLRLQAKLLALERSKGGSDVDFSRERLEEERKAHIELQKQYVVLEGYYNELLEYVRESENSKRHDDGSIIQGDE